MDRASAAASIDMGSIPVRIEPKVLKLVFKVFLLNLLGVDYPTAFSL